MSGEIAREDYGVAEGAGFQEAPKGAGPGQANRPSAAAGGVVNHAAAAWAALVQRALLSPCDPKTLRIWAGTAGCSTTLVKERCRLVGVSAKRTLDFARLLRALRLSEAQDVPMVEFLDNADPRTTRRLFRSFALAPAGRPAADTLLASAGRAFPARCLLELLPRLREGRDVEVREERRLSSAS